ARRHARPCRARGDRGFPRLDRSCLRRRRRRGRSRRLHAAADGRARLERAHASRRRYGGGFLLVPRRGAAPSAARPCSCPRRLSRSAGHRRPRDRRALRGFGRVLGAALRPRLARRAIRPRHVQGEQAMRCRNVQRALISVGACALVTAAVEAQPPHASAKRFDDVYWENVFDALERGREIFRFDNFGNEDFWGGTLRLHEAIAGRDHGGVGAGVSPEAALGLGLKVDIDALPLQLVQALRRGRVDLGDPAVTLSLLSLDAVVGVRGLFDDAGRLESVGITCALCHSTVDDAFAPGIGRRLDGWPNRDLDVGAIIAAAPDLSFFASLLGVSEDTVRDVLLDWGPGKFDAHLILDGRPTTPDGKTAAVLLPPAFGLAGVNLHTSNGWGSVTHWNAFVAVLEMQGKGTFYDPRLEDAGKFPIAAANGFGNVRPEEDLVTSKLGPLHLYQLSLQAPRPPRDLYDAEAAKRGEALFV